MRRLFAIFVLAPFLFGGTLAMAQSGHAMLGSGEMQWADPPPSLPRGATVVIIEGKPSEPGPSTMRLKFPAG